ncbi:hypothetical protein Tco_1280348, partial [Tanacetum coccineum]
VRKWGGFGFSGGGWTVVCDGGDLVMEREGEGERGGVGRGEMEMDICEHLEKSEVRKLG